MTEPVQREMIKYCSRPEMSDITFFTTQNLNQNTASDVALFSSIINVNMQKQPPFYHFH